MATEDYSRRYLYIRVVQAKLFMDNNYAGKIDVNNIADEACFSKFHFIRVFREIYGKTPHQYLMSIRIDKAAELLRKGKPVAEVCFSVGFESVSSFSGLFKRFIGVSPLMFQTTEHSRQQQMAAKPLSYIPGCFAYKYGWSEHSNFGEAGPKTLDYLSAATKNT